jgi:hypothetical protein
MAAISLSMICFILTQPPPHNTYFPIYPSRVCAHTQSACVCNVCVRVLVRVCVCVRLFVFVCFVLSLMHSCLHSSACICMNTSHSIFTYVFLFECRRADSATAAAALSLLVAQPSAAASSPLWLQPSAEPAAQQAASRPSLFPHKALHPTSAWGSLWELDSVR